MDRTSLRILCYFLYRIHEALVGISLDDSFDTMWRKAMRE